MADGKKILIIEDDKFLAKMLAKMLEESNHQTSLAVTGKEGIMKATANKPDLILLDIMLPDVDGFEVLKTIKQDQAVKDVPVIIMSNLGQPEDVAQGKQLGAIDHIVKSDFSLDDVVAKVGKAL